MMGSSEIDKKTLLSEQSYKLLGWLYRSSHPDEDSESGPRFVLHMLDILSPDLRGNEGINTENEIIVWVKKHGGTMPSSPFSTGLYLRGKKEERMEQEQIQWLGLAIAIALICGVLFALSRRTSERSLPSESALEPSPPTRPRSPPVHSLRLAMVLSASKLRDIGEMAASASDLLTRATYWWSGTPSEWSAIPLDIDAAKITGELADDEYIVTVFDVNPFAGSAPTSRPEGALALRQASAKHQVRHIATLVVRRPSDLEKAGFRR